jgi:hypothetical protein
MILEIVSIIQVIISILILLILVNAFHGSEPEIELPPIDEKIRRSIYS